MGSLRETFYSLMTGGTNMPCCLQERNCPEEGDKKRIHTWTYVGCNEESKLIFNEIPSNKNGKMILEAYRQILEEHIKPELEKGEQLILEEDEDSGHGHGSKTNFVAKWKKENKLKWYRN